MVQEMWTDPNLKNFHSRIRRIEKAHAKGYGFEARGTLGRSAQMRRKGSAGRTVGRLAALLAVAFALKGALHFKVGDEVYQDRVAGMATGTGFDPLAAQVMAADPVTRAISAFLGQMFAQPG